MSAETATQPVFDPENVAASMVAIREAMPLNQARLAGMQTGEIMSFRKGHGTEIDGAREYVPGDDVRFLDWPTTARQADHTLYLRERYQDIAPSAWILTDALQQRYRANPGYYSEQNLALSVMVAMMMAARASRFPVGVIAAPSVGQRMLNQSPKHRQELAVGHKMADAIALPEEASKLVNHRNRGQDVAVPQAEAAPAHLSDVLRYAGRQCNRSALVVVGDFRDVAFPDSVNGWQKPLRALREAGNSLLAVELTNPWDFEIPKYENRFKTPNGVLWVGNDKRGRVNRASYKEAALEQQEAIDTALAKAGAYHLKLSTADPQWLSSLRSQLQAIRKRR